MNNQLSQILRLTILLTLNLSIATGQTEFLVTVNPLTGTFTKIDSLPGVKWITTGPAYTVFDEINHRFIFKGADNIGEYLYSVDANTGSIISSPAFPVLSDPLDNIVELQFDNSANKLYGLHWDNSENREYFVSVDPATGAFTKIDSLPGVKAIAIIPGFTTFDKNNHHYFFNGLDNNGVVHLYTVDANTGSIVSNPTFPVLSDSLDNIIELQYDNSSNTLFGLHWDNSESREYLVSVNPATGVLTKIDSLPGVKWISTLPHYTTFDEINQRYIFRGGDTNGNSYLYSVDVNTGNIISNPLFPVFADPMDNIIELQFDNSSGKLFGLHWDANTETTISEPEIENNIFEVYPNPFSSALNILLEKNYSEVTIFIYNSSGHVVRKETHYNSSTIKLKKGNLPNGVYFISVIGDHINIGMKKITTE